MGINYKKLNFPCPPQEMLDACLSFMRNREIPQYKINSEEHMDFSVRLNTPWRSAMVACKFKQTNNLLGDMQPELVDWCRNNLPIPKQSYFKISIFENGEVVMPHTDRNVTNSINLVIDGDHATTSWYEPKEEFKHLEYPKPDENAQFLYERLNKVEEVKFEKNIWYILQNRKIHGVENIDFKTRIGLKICTNQDNLFEDLAPYYSIN